MKHFHSAALMAVTLALPLTSSKGVAQVPVVPPTTNSIPHAIPAENAPAASEKRRRDGSPALRFPTMGTIERLAPELDQLIASDAVIEKLADGFDWSEGPVWLANEKIIVFSDVPQNTVYAWSEADGLSQYLKPSGYTGRRPRGGEMGSNGLTTDEKGRLVLCQHGDRRVARYLGNGQFETLAEFFARRRFNSPNDLTYDARGNLYFTDPPYGLEAGHNSPRRELIFCGVYLLRPTGEVVLLTRDMTYPNGIALSPDGLTLYVAQSDSNAPIIKAFSVKPDGTVENDRVFFDATSLSPNRKGLPDGLKVDSRGNVFATGPGGVLVLNAEGKLLGILNTGEATANCNWGDDGSTLYITADMYLCRVRTLTSGATRR